MESWEDCSKSFLGEFLGFNSLDKVWQIKALELFHALDEVSVLGFSEDGEGFAELINGFDNFGAGFGELIPIDVGVFSDDAKDLIEVLLDCSNIDLTHVEKIIL